METDAIDKLMTSTRVYTLSDEKKEEEKVEVRGPYYASDEDFENAINKQVPQDVRQRMKALMLQYEDVWRDPRLGECKLTDFRIQTTGQVARDRCRPLPPDKLEFVKKQIDLLLANKAIRPSRSPYASPLVVVGKGDGTYRMTTDYRALNKITKMDSYPLPRMNDLLQNLAGKEWCVAFDMRSGYWQIPVEKDTVEKLAFITPFGLFEWLVAPFGPKTMPATCQRIMNIIFANDTDIQPYLDDIIFGSNDVDELLEVTKRILERCRESKMYLNIRKTYLLVKSVKALGFVLDKSGIHVDPKKIVKIRQFKTPKTLSEARSLFGLLSYIRHHIPQFEVITEPIAKLLEGGKGPREWGDEQQDAMKTILESLEKSMVLSPLNPNEDLNIRCDACDVGCGDK